MTERFDYQSTGVDYDKMDPFKRHAQSRAIQTSLNLNKWGFKEVPQSRGESAFVWEEGDSYRAEVIEGLGTKNLVADELFRLTGRSYYKESAIDTLAMIVNDVITVGAMPVVVSAYFAAGNSRWFETPKAFDLIDGFGMGCEEIGATWGGGESPTLKGIIFDETVDLAGSVHGIIRPKERLVLGEKLKAGDQIVTIESSGIHANGLTMARKIAETLPQGFLTPLNEEENYGEALLVPTHLYPPLVDEVFNAGIDVHYMANITGHGARKFMRADRNDLSYILTSVPQPQEIFKFIQEKSGNSDEEMYGNLNMGMGYAFYVPEKDVEKLIEVSKHQGLKAYHSGYIESGPRKVHIEPLGITFDELGVR